jgi:hypothetical protein
MLKITKAWTNRDRSYGRAAGYGYTFWLSSVDPSGRAWWLIGHVGGKGIGFTSGSVLEVTNEEEIERRVAGDEDDNDPGSWTVVDPGEAIAVTRAEMDRARDGIWAREHVDHFALVSAEYDLLIRAIEGADPVRKYERFRDPI